jgi:hypothetical protein
MLIQIGKINSQLANEQGLTLLHQSISTGLISITKFILSIEEINMNLCTETGESLFKFVLLNETSEIVELLLTIPNIKLWSTNKEG